MSQYPYANDPGEVNFYGQPSPPSQPAQSAPIDYLAPGYDPGYDPQGYASAAPTYTDPGYAEYTDPTSYSYAQPGVGYSVPTSYNTVAPYVPTTGYYYHRAPEHPSSTPALVWGLLGLFIFPPFAYVALAVLAYAASLRRPGGAGAGVCAALLGLGAVGRGHDAGAGGPGDDRDDQRAGGFGERRGSG